MSAQDLYQFAANRSEQEDHRTALSYLNMALEIDSKVIDATIARAQTNFAIGAYQSAISDCTKLLEEKPEDSNYHFLRGSIRHKADDLKGACEDWKKAAELGNEAAAELLKEHCQ